VLDVLIMLAQRQKLAIASGDPAGLVDVVSLSLGYYHEQPDDAAFDPMLLAPLTELGARGVAVVASAGNDATARQMFPAAFTPYPGGLVSKPDPNVVPLVSVGALNPNWRTIALFSNGGSWVRCYRPGASIVSTIPTTFNASEQPSAVVDIPGEGVRATIDPDDFTGGFATWSGTSFAAPYLAGEIAAAVLSGTYGALDPVDAGSAIARCWGALGRLIRMTP
jgi:subtilisin family serine protease